MVVTQLLVAVLLPPLYVAEHVVDQASLARQSLHLLSLLQFHSCCFNRVRYGRAVVSRSSLLAVREASCSVLLHLDKLGLVHRAGRLLPPAIFTGIIRIICIAGTKGYRAV